MATTKSKALSSKDEGDTSTKPKASAKETAGEQDGKARRTGRTIQLVHNYGCPTVIQAAETDEKTGRLKRDGAIVDVPAVESYAATRPRTDDRPARTVKVTRCRRCGAQVVTKPSATVTEVVAEPIDDEEDEVDGEEDEGSAGGGSS